MVLSDLGRIPWKGKGRVFGRKKTKKQKNFQAKGREGERLNTVKQRCSWGWILTRVKRTSSWHMRPVTHIKMMTDLSLGMRVDFHIPSKKSRTWLRNASGTSRKVRSVPIQVLAVPALLEMYWGRFQEYMSPPPSPPSPRNRNVRRTNSISPCNLVHKSKLYVIPLPKNMTLDWYWWFDLFHSGSSDTRFYHWESCETRWGLHKETHWWKQSLYCRS